MEPDSSVASLDRKKVQLLRENYSTKAVIIPNKRIHTVQFDYRQSHLKLSIYISLISALIMFVLKG